MNQRRTLKYKLAEISIRWRKAANALRQEVADGKCVRQSPESKLARAQVLDSNAEEIEELLTP